MIQLLLGLCIAQALIILCLVFANREYHTSLARIALDALAASRSKDGQDFAQAQIAIQDAASLREQKPKEGEPKAGFVGDYSPYDDKVTLPDGKIINVLRPF